MKLAGVAASLLAVMACASPAPARAVPPTAPGPTGERKGHAECAEGLDAVMQASLPPSWLPSEEQQGSCDVDPRGRLRKDAESERTVERGRSSDGPFTVAYKGPTGSGRYWEAEVSFQSHAGARGFCFIASTVGWRHVGADRLLAERMVALLHPWLQDVDGDGQDELVVPSSFSLSPDASLGDDGMTASVFARTGDRFVLDASLTRTLRLKIANAYRERAASTSHPPSPADRAHFRQAARQLARSCRGGER